MISIFRTSKLSTVLADLNNYAIPNRKEMIRNVKRGTYWRTPCVICVNFKWNTSNYFIISSNILKRISSRRSSTRKKVGLSIYFQDIISNSTISNDSGVGTRWYVIAITIEESLGSITKYIHISADYAIVRSWQLTELNIQTIKYYVYILSITPVLYFVILPS
jgi:hypothetical protein